jgi:hypothetical protein
MRAIRPDKVGIGREFCAGGASAYGGDPDQLHKERIQKNI